MTLRALHYSATAAVVVLLGCRDPFALSDGTFHGHYDTGLATIVTDVVEVRPATLDDGP